MSGLINQVGAKSGIIQPYRPYPNDGQGVRPTSGMTYDSNIRNTPNYDRPGDGPYTPDIYTSVLIQSNSTNNNTHFSDMSHWRHPVTRNGAVKHDTLNSTYILPKLGVTMMNFHGNNSDITMPDHSAFHQGTEWTIDFWFRGNKMYGGQHTNSGNGNPRDTFFLINNGSFGYYGYSTSGQWLETNVGVIDDAPHHFAIVVMGNDIDNGWSTDSRKRRFLLFKDGELIHNVAWNQGGGFNSNTYHLGKFKESNTADSWADGMLGEYRFSVGIARWTKNFKIWK